MTKSRDRCVAITGKGTLCKHGATHGPYCAIHSPSPSLTTIEQVLDKVLELAKCQ